VFTHLLVPLDGSEYALRALKYSEDLAKATGARLTLLGVLLRPERPDVTHVEKLDEQSHARLQSELDSLVQQVKARSALSHVDAEVRFGQPARQITDYAKTGDIDLIVMSTHGLGATGQYALGSVALKVLMTAECPVFMVRIPSHGAPQE
jgi:nucleotide-binding universal stress UspA family protein